MKIVKKITLALLGVVVALNFVAAQNYKAPKIDASGKMYNRDGKYMGNINVQGEITDTLGTKIAFVDGSGMLVDAKTGKKLGKAEKNGNYVPYFSEIPTKGWTTGAPMNGTCLVKDENGNVKAEIHENYKQFGACAIHCMENQMKHNEVLDNSKKPTGVYSCPMHPEMVSDKPAKCGKCGMEMKKK